jgi:hypothetical protein
MPGGEVSAPSWDEGILRLAEWLNEIAGQS